MGENGEKQQICVIRLLFPSNHFWQGKIDHFSYSVTPDIHLKGISHFYESWNNKTFMIILAQFTQKVTDCLLKLGQIS